MFKHSDRDRSFYLAEWRVDPTRNRITSGDRSVTLEPRVMTLLVKLATACGQVVPHKALVEEVWGGRVVSDEAIFRAVSELRKALGDDPRNPRFVETIRKRGYRLAVLAKPDSHSASKSPLLPTVAGVAILLIAVMTILITRSRVDPVRAAPLIASTPLTTLPGRELDPAISNDGQRVAFARNQDGEYDLYTKHVEGESLSQLTDSAGFEGHAAWSPNETQIAYIAERPNGPRLEIIDSVAGGPPVQSLKLDDWSYGLDWSPNGRQIALSQAADGKNVRIVFFDLDSRELLPPRWPYSGQREYKPVFSPDGERVAFMRGDDSELAQIWVADIESGALAQITTTPMSYRGIDWAPDGQNLVAAASTGGDFHLWQIPIDNGSQATVIGGIESQPFNPTISKSGRLAYESAVYDTNIWRHTLNTGVDELLLSSTRQDRHPDVSSDQSRIVFVSDRTGSPQLWVADASGENTLQLTQLGDRYVASPRFSPDGHKISFQTETDGLAKVAIYRLDEGRIEILDLGNTQAFPIRWKSETSLIVYVVDDKSSESVVVGLDGQTLHTLGPGIVVDDANGNKIVVDPDVQIARRIKQSGVADTVIRNINPTAWAFGPGRVYFSQFRGEQSFAYGVADGLLTEFALLPSHDRAQFSVSEDGNTVYYGRIDSSRNDLYWRDLKN